MNDWSQPLETDKESSSQDQYSLLSGLVLISSLGTFWLLSKLRGSRQEPDNSPQEERDARSQTPPVPARVIIDSVHPTSKRREDREDRQEQRDRTRLRWEKTTAGILLVYTIITGFMWDATRRAARAAESAATTAAKQFDAAERPWVSLNVELAGPLEFDKNYGSVKTRVILKNSGHSPATRIWIEPEFFPIPPANVAGERDRLCNQTRGHQKANPQMGETLVPGGDFRQEVRITKDRADADRASKANQGALGPTVIFCVAYLPS